MPCRIVAQSGCGAAECNMNKDSQALMRIRIFLLLVAMLVAADVAGASRRYTLRTMKRVFAYASSVDTTGLQPRESYAYLKYDIRTNRRNAILLTIPTMFAVANAGDREHVGETYDRVVTRRPGDFHATRMLERSTVPHQTRTMPTLLKYLTPHIYDELIIDRRIMSPFHIRNRRYYRYQVSFFSDDVAFVSFRPRLNNTKLVKGWARVESATGRVLETAFDGEYDLVRFHLALTTGGDGGVESLLPSECSLNARFLFMGNDITAEYTSVYNLPRIITDSIVNRRDTAMLNRVRPMPLTAHEQFLYDRYYARRNDRAADSLSASSRRQRFTAKLWRVVGKSMFDRVRQNFGSRDQGHVRIGPLFNPLYFSYSSRRGLTYKLDLRSSYYLNDHQAFEMRFKLGYAFKQRQMFFNFPFTFYMDRRHNAYVRTEWASGRRITSSEVADAVKNERGDSIDWNAMQLEYFRDHSFKVVVNYDPSPHWGLELGLMAHRRRAVNPQGFAEVGRPSVYTSVAPTFELTWRPSGYNGPVITADYERSVRGLLGSSMAYERMEFDGQYIHSISALSNLQMRVGTGFYTHKGKGSYFLDYTNFRENNVPGGWNDEWACSFELLNRNWYNASEYYVRANVAYETTQLLLAWMPLAGRLVERERIYVNALSVRHLHPYVEYGYGFTTRAFSLAAFLGQRNWRVDGFTVRLGFELFRHW